MKNYGEIVNSQKEFFYSEKTKKKSFRVEMLKKLKVALKENEPLLYKAIASDFKKSKFETYETELSMIYAEINLATKNIKKWTTKNVVGTNLPNLPGISYTKPEPLGNILVIGAWNYPYQLSLVPCIAAISAGNTVILKPSELPSETSSAMAEIINSNFDVNFFTVVEGGRDETTAILKEKFDKIFFTGSTKVGQIIYKAAAENLTPVCLELGGKSPVFVMEDADIDMTAKRLTWAKFLNAGQTCVAPDYILVQKSVEEKLLKAIEKYITRFFGNDNDIKDNYVQIINEANFSRLRDLIIPEQVFCGGKSDLAQRYIQPTVLHNITFEDEIMKEEIFGPILPVISFESINEVVNIVKRLPKALSCYVYTRSKKHVTKITSEISFGGGAINDSVMQLSNERLPFGGVGTSGMGRYHGKFGFDEFSHHKAILEKTFLAEPNLKYPPYTKTKEKVLKTILE